MTSITIQIKRHSHSIVIFIGLLCFVIALCFFSLDVPGSNRILSMPISTIKKAVEFRVNLSASNNPHRISIYYKSRGHSSQDYAVNLTIKNSHDIVLREIRNGRGSAGNREGNLYWAYTNYGTFEVSQTGEYQFNFEINSLPSNILNADVIISTKSSGNESTFFSMAGVVIFLFLFVNWKRLNFAE